MLVSALTILLISKDWLPGMKTVSGSVNCAERLELIKNNIKKSIT
jgi:hypothetical protein